MLNIPEEMMELKHHLFILAYYKYGYLHVAK